MLEPSADCEGSWVVAEAGLSYGGVAPKSIMAEKVSPRFVCVAEAAVCVRHREVWTVAAGCLSPPPSTLFLASSFLFRTPICPVFTTKYHSVYTPLFPPNHTCALTLHTHRLTLFPL